MIHIITTGGTIEGLDYETIESKNQKRKISIEDFFRSANVSFSYSVESVLNKDSRSITDEDRQLLVDKIRAIGAKKNSINPRYFHY
ncbi:asparaginase domain-containing protein [uncultured Zobellia sp.]|uniref:asparaginase domain-containing protein n=1 Tax=uncultured Zobellia sp. TaxID=255433 RepID=UPI0025954BA1|nr:asparaginase domain-containing protein [uncultured Zobellia sp.]